MEALAHLVAESLIRHGLETTVDHRRLQWSQWFRCRDSFSFLLAPCKPGLFALAEEVVASGEIAAGEGKRMLALYRISEANDLGMAMGRLFLPGNPERERLRGGRCFARYVVVEDSNQRHAAFAAMQRWMASNADLHESYAGPDALVRAAEHSSGSLLPQTCSPGRPSEQDALVSGDGFVSGHDFSRAAKTPPLTAASAAAFPADASEPPQSSNKEAQIGPPAPIPSGF